MITETLDEVVAYLKGTAAVAGLLQVDCCETEQISSPNNALVEFSYHDRSSLVYTIVVTSDTCYKTLRLANLLKTRLEYKYQWVKSEAFTNKKNCSTCDQVKITIKVPVAAPPAVYEDALILPQIFDINLAVGFCPPPKPVQVDVGTLQNVVLIKPIDCCDLASEGGLPGEYSIATFTNTDLKQGKFTVSVAESAFFVRDQNGDIAVPDSVKKIGKDLYSIGLGSRLPIAGTWSVSRL